MNITISETIFINHPPEMVWDFTQDYSKRPLWDGAIKEAKVIQDIPRKVAIKGNGGLIAELLYKHDDRPNKTTLAMANVKSPFVSGGGGSWKYVSEKEGTMWTQTNTLSIKDSFLMRLLKPLIIMSFRGSTRKAMRIAKKMMEKQN